VLPELGLVARRAQLPLLAEGLQLRELEAGPAGGLVTLVSGGQGPARAATVLGPEVPLHSGHALLQDGQLRPALPLGAGQERGLRALLAGGPQVALHRAVALGALGAGHLIGSTSTAAISAAAAFSEASFSAAALLFWSKTISPLLAMNGETGSVLHIVPATVSKC
jgi:hypothetical protein